MNVLLTGAGGFIGRALDAELRRRGHRVVRVERPKAGGAATDTVQVDFNHALDPPAWRTALAGIDVVVNAAGIFRESPRQSFWTVHSAAPRALFDACVQNGVRRVIQVSALGAERGTTPFLATKAEADGHLLALRLDAVVVRPSLVFGTAGTSARAFLRLAAAPLLLLPAGGRQRVQPIHIDDVVAALCACVEGAQRGVVPLVGPRPLMLRDYLRALRAALGLAPAAAEVTVPRAAVAAGALVGEWRGSLLTRASWQMLEAGNVADVAGVTQLLGRAPRAPERFIDGEPLAALRAHARLGWVLPLLRAALAAVWILTAIVSLWVFPVEESLALLHRTGVPWSLAPLLLVGAAGLDFLFGVLTAFPPGSRSARRWLWGAQAALIVVYSAIIAWRLPAFWAHPFGPLLKNLPILAVLAALAVLDDD